VTIDVPLITLAANGAPVRTRDRLVIRVNNRGGSFTLTAGGRLLQEDGTQTDLQLSQNIAATTINNEFTFPLLDGWLLSFQANAQGTVIRQGDVWIECFIGFGAGGSTQRYKTIFTGYIDQLSSIGWPVADRRVPRNGPGRITVPVMSNPVAGAQWASVPTGGVGEKIHAISAILTTDGTAANRSVSITIEESSGGIVAEIPFTTVQTASKAARYTLAIGASHVEDAVTNIFVQGMPDMIMIEDWVIRSVVANMQAADAWTQVTGASERWEGVFL